MSDRREPWDERVRFGARVVIVGGGVHATVVADCLRAQGRAEIVGYCDEPEHDPSHMKGLGIDYLGDDGEVRRLARGGGATAGILGMAGLAHTALRKRLAAELSKALPAWWTAIHPSAVIAESARIEEGTVIFARAVVNPLACIGRHAVINTAAVVEHHCDIGDFAVVSPHATLCGCVRVGEAAFIGAGAVVVTDRLIGAGAIVGAGAVVTRDVPPGAVVAGNPAKAIREHTPHEAVRKVAAL
jgi:sugar O-acyltransferase (sialic acid O-acetyltransferase NeuD family)